MTLNPYIMNLKKHLLVPDLKISSSFEETVEESKTKHRNECKLCLLKTTCFLKSKHREVISCFVVVFTSHLMLSIILFTIYASYISPTDFTKSSKMHCLWQFLNKNGFVYSSSSLMYLFDFRTKVLAFG